MPVRPQDIVKGMLCKEDVDAVERAAASKQVSAGSSRLRQL